MGANTIPYIQVTRNEIPKILIFHLWVCVTDSPRWSIQIVLCIVLVRSKRQISLELLDVSLRSVREKIIILKGIKNIWLCTVLVAGTGTAGTGTLTKYPKSLIVGQQATRGQLATFNFSSYKIAVENFHESRGTKEQERVLWIRGWRESWGISQYHHMTMSIVHCGSSVPARDWGKDEKVRPEMNYTSLPRCYGWRDGAGYVYDVLAHKTSGATLKCILDFTKVCEWHQSTYIWS